MAKRENSVGMTSILAVFACPEGYDGLRLGAEDRVIHECLDRSISRGSIRLEVLHAATVHDLRRALLGAEYSIVQFSGHGTGGGLVLETSDGEPQLVPQDAMAELLSAYSPPIQCVILNACYSDVQGGVISLGVPFTIGMDGPISDEAATEFARGFYDAIGAGRDIEFAFEEGCRCVALTGLSRTFRPVYFTETRPEEKGKIKVVFQGRIQFEEEEEEGILDYLAEGTKGFEAAGEIMSAMRGQTDEFDEAIRNDTMAMNSLGEQRTGGSTRELKRIISGTAQALAAFAEGLEEQTPRFRDAYSRAVDCFGKALGMYVADFDGGSAEEIEEALAAVVGLKDGIGMAREGVGRLRQSIAGTPRLVKSLNQAKRRCLVALDTLDGEMAAAIELTVKLGDSVGILVA